MRERNYKLGYSGNPEIALRSKDGTLFLRRLVVSSIGEELLDRPLPVVDSMPYLKISQTFRPPERTTGHGRLRSSLLSVSINSLQV